MEEARRDAGLSQASVEQRGAVALLRVDRAPANALDPTLLREMLELLDRLSADPPGAVVVTGREGFFCGGLDLKVLPGLDLAAQRALVDGIDRLLAGWYGFPRPVVCAVNGHAVAGGFVFALCGDRRIGCPRGSFGLTELRAGIPYPAAAMAVASAELSAAAARRLILGAELVGPDDALALGLFDEVVEEGRVVERALEVAAGLAALPSETYGAVKRQLRGPALGRVQAAILAGGDPVAERLVGAETGAAAAAILDHGGSGA